MSENGFLNNAFTTMTRCVMEIAILTSEVIDCLCDGKVYDFSISRHIDRIL
ncbi:MAG: hypothetical protein ACRBBN_00740 [Methyloligellaceae bacterium]